MNHKSKKPINKKLLAELTVGKRCGQPLFDATVKNLLKTPSSKHTVLKERIQKRNK